METFREGANFRHSFSQLPTMVVGQTTRAHLARSPSPFSFKRKAITWTVLPSPMSSAKHAPKPFEDITDADWLAIIETNFMSGVRLSRLYLPRMRAVNWGRIIFISSESAVNIPVEMIHYGVTKTMQVALARGLAETTAGTGVTVNSVLAGPTRSEGVEEFIAGLAKSKGLTPAAVEKDFFRSARPSSLLQRFATTDEVAALAAFVASPLSSATNGAALRVEGGLVRSIL